MRFAFVTVTKSGIVTASTRSAATENVIVTGQAGRKRNGTESGGTERKRMGVISPLAGM